MVQEVSYPYNTPDLKGSGWWPLSFVLEGQGAGLRRCRENLLPDKGSVVMPLFQCKGVQTHECCLAGSGQLQRCMWLKRGVPSHFSGGHLLPRCLLMDSVGSG